MTYGFIGCGNMGGAIARAVCAGAGAENVLLANRTRGKAEALAAELGCRAGSNLEAAACGAVVLGVKPQMMAGVMAQIAPVLKENPPRLLISMAAGITAEKLLAMAGADLPVLRIMPNTPAALGAGMTLYTPVNVPEDVLREALDALSPSGLLDEVPESMMDAAGTVSGCGPAWAYQMIEALADGGVACGVPRAKAQRYAAQMMLGAARMALESGKHPGQLKDEVCSPGGSTIQGVRVLEERGFRAALIDAVIAAVEKTKKMG